MWLIFVEAGVAVFLLVFIVWWTVGSSQSEEKKISTLDKDREE